MVLIKQIEEAIAEAELRLEQNQNAEEWFKVSVRDQILTLKKMLKGAIATKNDNTFVAQYKHGDQVRLNFFDGGVIELAKVTKVAFTKSKVLYDVEVKVGHDQYTRIHGIDSAFVHLPVEKRKGGFAVVMPR